MKPDERRSNLGWFIFPLMAVPVIGLMFLAIIWQEHVGPIFKSSPKQQADVAGSLSKFFTPHYPQNTRFQSELKLLRETERLELENEVLINKMVVSSANELNMPPSLLWCLLFQESRLNHLLGVSSSRGARGLGQFSYFGFWEINHHLDRYSDSNAKMIRYLLGKDIRPLSANPTQLEDPSSYYYIPTAVTASASYLNNRYLQLQNNLERKKIFYDPNLLWMYAAMAYNKGARSVLSFWNNARREGGQLHLYELLVDKSAFFSSIESPERFERALARIWSEATAKDYARELTVHMKQIRACAIRPDQARRKNNGEKSSTSDSLEWLKRGSQ